MLEPQSDGFRNYRPSTHALIDRAHMLGLSAVEMGVLVAGMRVMGSSPVGQLSKMRARPPACPRARPTAHRSADEDAWCAHQRLLCHDPGHAVHDHVDAHSG